MTRGFNAGSSRCWRLPRCWLWGLPVEVVSTESSWRLVLEGEVNACLGRLVLLWRQTSVSFDASKSRSINLKSIRMSTLSPSSRSMWKPRSVRCSTTSRFNSAMSVELNGRASILPRARDAKTAG